VCDQPEVGAVGWGTRIIPSDRLINRELLHFLDSSRRRKRVTGRRSCRTAPYPTMLHADGTARCKVGAICKDKVLVVWPGTAQMATGWLAEESALNPDPFGMAAWVAS